MKQLVIVFSLVVFLIAGITAVTFMADTPPTYDGSDEKALVLYDNAVMGLNPAYDLNNVDGSASLIVKKTLSETNAINAVTAVVFDFRGYDTMGEAFILITAISGCMAILRKSKKGKGAEADESGSQG